VLTVFALLLHFAPHAFHILIATHIYAYTLDHAEVELQEPMEQAQAEEFTNLALDQDKPWCICHTQF
jgi:hypothetical protein